MARVVTAERDPVLIGKCAQAHALARRGVLVYCPGCNRQGSFLGLVYHWQDPITRGGERTSHNVNALCDECWARTGRRDGVTVPMGASIHAREARNVDRPSPIHVIEL